MARPRRRQPQDDPATLAYNLVKDANIVVVFWQTGRAHQAARRLVHLADAVQYYRATLEAWAAEHPCPPEETAT